MKRQRQQVGKRQNFEYEHKGHISQQDIIFRPLEIFFFFLMALTVKERDKPHMSQTCCKNEVKNYLSFQGTLSFIPFRICS